MPQSHNEPSKPLQNVLLMPWRQVLVDDVIARRCRTSLGTASYSFHLAYEGLLRMMENCALLGVFVREHCLRKDHREADALATFYFFSCQMERPFSPHRSPSLMLSLSGCSDYTRRGRRRT